jgi:prephenate dehydrogenase
LRVIFAAVSVPPRNSPVALLGVGYIGGSVVLAARRAGLLGGQVVGYDPDPDALTVALGRGIVDVAASSPEEAVAGATLVILAAPVASLAALARRLAPGLSSGALVIDVGSVKGSVGRDIEAALPDGQFVGCHPLAGTERSGAVSAEAALFEGRICFICPGARAAPAAVEGATQFWEALGARTLRVDPERHDFFMAAVSHLPHVAAFALAASLGEVLPVLEANGPAAGSTTSLRDTTRIAASNPAVWRDIFLENRGPLLPLIAALEGRVASLRRALEERDAQALESLLTEGQSCRRRLVENADG